MGAAIKLTTKDMQDAFGVTPMTIFNWRKGSPTRDPLPCEQQGRSVLYPVSKVRAWAKRHGVVPVRDLGEVERGVLSKPGPKTAPRAEPA